MRFLVVEHYTHGPEPVYRRAAERGRMLPDGLRYVDSWIVDDGNLDRCFQLMETDDPALIETWRHRWRDLATFEIHPVIDSSDASRRLGINWSGGDDHLDRRSHRWELDAREVRRHEQRRGRRHAFEHLDPHRTALVVVDMVPFFAADSPFVRGIVPTINRSAALLRSVGGTVAWIMPAVGDPPPIDDEFYGPSVAAAYSASGGSGPLRDRLWHELDVDPEDLVLEKSAASAFFPGRCSLPDELGARDINSILVAGTIANVCCEATVRDARTLGYRVIMLADANAAPTDEMLNATLRTVYRSFGDVRPAGDIARLFTSGSSSAELNVNPAAGVDTLDTEQGP